MKRFVIVCAVLAGCSPVVSSTDDPNLPIIRDYRAAGDPCKFVGESAVTIDFLDDAADLVACPTGMEGIDAFIADTGAQEVGRYESWTLYSVTFR